MKDDGQAASNGIAVPVTHSVILCSAVMDDVLSGIISLKAGGG